MTARFDVEDALDEPAEPTGAEPIGPWEGSIIASERQSPDREARPKAPEANDESDTAPSATPPLTSRPAPRPKRVLSPGRLVVLCLIALLPSALKRLAYRWLFGYRIGKRTRIGLTLLDATECEIGDDVRIGHFNVFMRLGRVAIGDHCRIGILNVFRGGEEVSVGRYVDVLRMNVINSIPENDCVGAPDARITIGDGSVVTEGHRLDFTDRIEIGRCVILGGRNSSLWTHNRRRTKPIRIGDHCYLGSEIRMAPGVVLPARTVVGLGSIVVGRIGGEKKLVAGNPARVLRDLGPDDMPYVTERTRPDLPDDIACGPDARDRQPAASE